MYDDLTNLLTSSQGSMAYHMVLSFVLLSSLAIAINHSLQKRTHRNQRQIIGLALLIVIRLLLFVIAGLGAKNIFSLENSLPSVNRLADTLTILTLIWLWAFPQPGRKEDIISILSGILISLGGIIAIFLWSQQDISQPFNTTRLSFYWSLFNIILLLCGELILILRQPNQLSMGLVMITTLLCGEIGHAIFPNEGFDYPFWVRLTQLAALPLLFGIPYDSPTYQDDITQKTHPSDDLIQKPSPADLGNTGIDQGVFRSALSLIKADSKEEICLAFCRFIAQSMVADICLILMPQSTKGSVVLECGYDLIVQEQIPHKTFEQSVIPGLATAISHKKPLVYPLNSPDLNNLRQLLLLREIGHFLAVPIYDEDETVCIIVLLSPYSKHEWTITDQQYIRESTPEIISLIQRLFHAAPKITAKTTAPVLPVDDEKLLNELAVLQAQNISYEEQLANLKKLGEDYSASLEIIRSLEEKNKLLTQNLKQGGVEILERSITDQGDGTNSFHGVIASLVQELHQPMSSITGYTDLLLSESVGVLSGDQKNYLDRIRASTDRIHNLISNLDHISLLDSDKETVIPESIDLSEIIDEVITHTSAQIRQKEIVLRVDLPDQLPKLYSDKNAVQKILFHLFENAISATPPAAEIYVQAKLQNGNLDSSTIQLSITDSGKGIPQDKIPQVFSRLEDVENPPIPGVGNKGAGLSISKSLVEKLGGQIWVESVQDKGSTFHLLLPLLSMDHKINGETIS